MERIGDLQIEENNFEHKLKHFLFMHVWFGILYILHSTG